MKKIIPLGQRIIVERDEPENVSNLILTLDSSKTKSLTGTVLSVSADLDSDRIKIGDKVMFLKYGGIEIEMDKKDCVVLLYTDVIGVVKE